MVVLVLHGYRRQNCKYYILPLIQICTQATSTNIRRKKSNPQKCLILLYQLISNEFEAEGFSVVAFD